MESRKMFERMQTLSEDISCIQEQIEAYETIAEKCTQFMSLTAGCQSSGDDRKLEDITILIAAEKDRKRNMEDELKALEVELTKLLGKLHNRKYAKLLRLRYISNLDWPEIAEEMDLSQSYVLHLNDPAIKAVEKVSRNIA